MKIKNDLKAGGSYPYYGFIDMRSSALDEWIAEACVCSVADRNTDDVEAGFFDLFEVGEGYPCVPVFLEAFEGFVFSEGLGECPFVDYGGIS